MTEDLRDRLVQGQQQLHGAAVKYCPECGLVVRQDEARCPLDKSLLLSADPSNFRNSEAGKQFEVLEVLGCGGWGVVFKAKQISLNRLVAIKMLHSHFITRPDLAARFEREAALISHLNHPNVTSVIDYGALPTGETYLVMELLEGKSMRQILDDQEKISIADAYPILKQVCSGLESAHSKKIIHRDIKLSNIHVMDFGQPNVLAKLMDFGLARLLDDDRADGRKLTQTGCTLGTPDYMSPEQCRGCGVDARSDIYSLGCVIYEMLAGRLPLVGNNAMDVLHRQVNEEPLPLKEHGVDVSPALQSLIDKALEKDPALRFQAASELGAALDECMQNPSAVMMSASTRKQDVRKLSDRATLLRGPRGRLRIAGR